MMKYSGSKDKELSFSFCLKCQVHKKTLISVCRELPQYRILVWEYLSCVVFSLPYTTQALLWYWY
uniref:Uncharacterized protein n=1 Tax=Anguilla anguilla TaxID=7936 RepID=A0A0E9R6Z4_ANGAN